jgi:hypothetical protein
VPGQYRTRSPSGHDIPIPESVFHAIHHVDAKVEGVRAEVAGIGDKVDKLVQAVAERNASWKDKAVTQFGAIALAALAAMGGSRLIAPAAPEPTRVEVVHTPINAAMATECMSIQPGTNAQAECFARVQAEIQSGKRPATPTPTP